MDFAEFFTQAPTITLQDPLAIFLGASKSGLITYSYTDAVKLAGHSCPTVAGAYLMVRSGLRHLYGSDTPRRGDIEVYLRGARDEGTTGVIAAVATLITGAASEIGFGGIGADHHFARRDLMRFNAPIDGLLALRRRDTGRGAVLDLDAAIVPPHPDLRALMAKAVAGQANDAEQARFAALWQDRVKRMLLDSADDVRLIQIAEVNLVYETAPAILTGGLAGCGKRPVPQIT